MSNILESVAARDDGSEGSAAHRGTGHNYDSTSIRLSFDRRSTAIQPRYDHSTTYDLQACVGCCV